MYRVTGLLSLDFVDPSPHIFDKCLEIQLGDIVSPRCLLTESDISACLSSSNATGIQITLGWFVFEPLNKLNIKLFFYELCLYRPQLVGSI